MAPVLRLVNTATLRLFNFLYYHRPGIRRRRREHFQSFLLSAGSAWLNWNRLSVPVGSTVSVCHPEQAGPEATRAAARKIALSGQGSFLAVLKQFGG